MSPSSNRKTLIIVLSVAGVGGLVVVLACAGLIYLGTRAFAELPRAQEGAEQFFETIKAGRVDEAYRSTAPAFRAKVTPDQFRALVERYPALKNATRRTVGGMRILGRPGGVQAVLQYHLADDHNTLSLTLTLVKPGDRWVVEGLDLP